MTAELHPAAVILNEAQRNVFDDLLATGATRPYSPSGISERLYSIIETGTRASLKEWTEPSLWMSKSHIVTALRCEGQTVAHAANTAPDIPNLQAVAGIVAHRAIQVAYTHPGHPIRKYVDWSLEAAIDDETHLKEAWNAASPARQSDVVALAMDRVAGFLDSWPPLSDEWEPRFEVSIQAKVGRLRLAGRMDLVLGRPRPPRQTMLLCDIKTGALHDEHPFEAAFYALLATLRTGVAPYRSVVYSTASGEWSQPADVNETLLTATAQKVAEAVNAHVALLTEAKQPSFNPGRYCRWCPAHDACPAASVASQVDNMFAASPAAAPAPPVPASVSLAPPAHTKLAEAADAHPDFGPFDVEA